MTEDRWLTSGKTVYNNKGNAVKQYEPYYINTPAYVSNPIVDTFGVSPTIYYDPLDRVTKTITAKGYLLTHAWTAWEETVSDANDTFVISPYCQVNVLQVDTQSPYYDATLSGEDRQALAAIISNPSDPNPPNASTALGRALVYNVQYFANTPARSVRDNLGRVIISQVINKSQDNPTEEVLSSYYTYDILGRELTSADPRLHAAGKYNFESTYSLTGAVLKHISADAGTRWALSNTLGNPIWGYDERQVTITPSYDALHRPTQIHVHKVATEKDPLTLNQVVEKFIYGDAPGAINNPEENNLRGQLYQHYDQAGLVTVPSYSLLGASLRSQRQFRIGYKTEV
ncbi:hypothetical protein GR268_42240, partial [Rhizobium leguminosarum]|nr:hypothetical protein [Rhizobium leguminosarum]